MFDNVGKNAHFVDTRPRDVSNFPTYDFKGTARCHLFTRHRAGVLRILHPSDLESTFDGTNQKIAFARANFEQATTSLTAISFDQIEVKASCPAFKAFYGLLTRLASTAQEIIAGVNTAQFII